MAKQLNEVEINILKAFKGTRGGADRFFDLIELIYKDDPETYAEIEQCRTIKDDLDWIESLPAWEKTRTMYYHYMDELLYKIGYYPAARNEDKK